MEHMEHFTPLKYQNKKVLLRDRKRYPFGGGGISVLILSRGGGTLSWSCVGGTPVPGPDWDMPFPLKMRPGTRDQR